MKKRFARILSVVLCILMMTSTVFAATPTKVYSGKQYVTRQDWAPDVKKAINDFIAMYGKDSPNYDPNSYVVFDFDDTTAIYDVAVATRYHRLQTMQFQFTPEELPAILATDFGDLDVPRSASYSKDGVMHTYREWIDDITAAYTHLWNTYGPFNYKGLSPAMQKKVQADPMWLEFAVKIQNLPKVCMASESDYEGYPAYKYWNAGMTPDEAYYVSQSTYKKWNNAESKKVTWTTPDTIESKVGVSETSWTEGISVSKNMVELYRALHENGFDVYVVSASGTDEVRAAVDFFGLHDYVTGVLAYTNKLKDGKNVAAYDYEFGAAWYTKDSGWERGKIAVGAQTNTIGKVTAVNNVLVSQYGCGPLAAFGDSSGDYEMVTVYDSLKLVVFCNVGKKVNNAGLLYNVALYERDHLGYDLAKANANGDTFYVLQGRDENGTRSFRSSESTIYLGQKEEKLFANDDAQKLLDYMVAKDMTVKEVLDRFTIKTAVDAKGNDTGIAYGLRNAYPGYHSMHF